MRPAMSPAVAALAASIVIVAGVTMCAPPSRAQQIVICFPAAGLDQAMLQHARQTPVAGGMLDPQHIMRIYAGADGSFSIFRIGADGTACLVASGDGWEVEPAGRPS